MFLIKPGGIKSVIAQNASIDSLEKILAVGNDQEKIESYYILTDYYAYNATDKAIRLANEFLKLGEKYDSLNIIEHSYQILGESYFFQELYDKSLEYFLKYLDLQETNNKTEKLGRAYNNLGIVYRAKEDYGRAIDYYQKSLEINLELNDINGLSSTYNNLGVLHEHLNLYGQARDYYQKSLEIELQLNDIDGLSTSYLNLGAINLKLNNYDKALEYCFKSIDLCDSSIYRLTLELNYETLYKIYKKIGETNKALESFEKFYELKNSRINDETNSQIAELEIKYQTEKHQQEILLLQKQKRQKNILNTIILIGLTIFISLVIILIVINKQRRNRNDILRQQNAEILQQNEEIEAQRDEIEAQRDEITRQVEISNFQKQQILKQKKDITDSIEYAQHIQQALLPDKITLQKVLKNGFCLFKPKDIVSGDFYWVANLNNKSIIVASDCTGHGVPGAFMSIIGINFLNEIIFDEKIIKPNEILSELRKKIIKTMIHSNRTDETKDGMDMAIIVIDYENLQLEYAGAYINLFFIRDHMLQVVKANKMPVGISEKPIAPFTNNIIEIKHGDQFYMFSDGYADQFGGNQHKKFRVGNLRDLLLEIHEKEMSEQKMALYEAFLKWKDNQPQVDDILAIGVKI